MNLFKNERNYNMGLFGPSKIKITPPDFVRKQLDGIFSDQYAQADSGEFARLSQQSSVLREVRLDIYIRERRDAICSIFEIAWCRGLSEAMFIEYSSLVTDDSRVKEIHSEAYDMALSRAQEAGIDTFGYISRVFIGQIIPNGFDRNHPDYSRLYTTYGTDFTSRFIAFEAVIKRHKLVTQV
ncbi:MAG: hypothetical protein NTV46_10065 [Verrucomicrobia bacterium]|nr:hypothetical protein [Verrucomicrobiota bacterium]